MLGWWIQIFQMFTECKSQPPDLNRLEASQCLPTCSSKIRCLFPVSFAASPFATSICGFSIPKAYRPFLSPAPGHLTVFSHESWDFDRCAQTISNPSCSNTYNKTYRPTSPDLKHLETSEGMRSPTHKGSTWNAYHSCCVPHTWWWLGVGWNDNCFSVLNHLTPIVPGTNPL